MSGAVYAWCNAGLGNRLSTLAGALYLAEKLSYNFFYYWPVDNWCGCHFNELFKSNFIERPDIDIRLKGKNVMYTSIQDKNILTYLETKYNSQLYSVKDLDRTLPCQLKLFDNIIYNNCELYTPGAKNIKRQCFKHLQIEPSIAKKAKEFINEHHINKSWIGIHLRETDCPSESLISISMQHIHNNPNQKFFICSDCKKTELLFSIYPNVVFYPKREYVIYNNNTLIRTKQSVKEAVIDMLLLSQTTPLKEIEKHMYNVSTFFSAAMELNVVNL